MACPIRQAVKDLTSRQQKNQIDAACRIRRGRLAEVEDLDEEAVELNALREKDASHLLCTGLCK